MKIKYVVIAIVLIVFSVGIGTAFQYAKTNTQTDAALAIQNIEENIGLTGGKILEEKHTINVRGKEFVVLTVSYELDERGLRDLQQIQDMQNNVTGT